MGVLDVAQRLRALAADPEHRRGIVAEQGMLPTLTVFLENGDVAKKPLLSAQSSRGQR